MGDRLGIHSAVDLFNDDHLYSVVGTSTEGWRVDEMTDAYSAIWILSGACNTKVRAPIARSELSLVSPEG